MFTWRGKWEKFGDVLAQGKVTLLWLMNSNVVKLEQFDYLYLVYHFTVPLKVPNSKLSCQLKGKRLNRGPGHGLEIPVIY